jgi:hypothetical protein
MAQTNCEKKIVTRADLISMGFSDKPGFDLGVIAENANSHGLNLNQAAWMAHKKAIASVTAREISSSESQINVLPQDAVHSEPLAYRIDWSFKSPESAERYDRARHSFNRVMCQPRINGGELNPDALAAGDGELPIGSSVLSQTAYMPGLLGERPVQGVYESHLRAMGPDSGDLDAVTPEMIEKSYTLEDFPKLHELMAAVRILSNMHGEDLFHAALIENSNGMVGTRIRHLPSGLASMSTRYSAHEVDRFIFAQARLCAAEHTRKINPEIPPVMCWLEATSLEAQAFQTAVNLLQELRVASLRALHEEVARVSGYHLVRDQVRPQTQITREMGGAGPIIRHFRKFW